MPIGSAVLMTAINARWESSGLDLLFRGTWTSSEQDQYSSLNDVEAAAGQPRPYCVFVVEQSGVRTRMSKTKTTKKELRTVPFEFHVHTQRAGGRSAKAIAADLVAAIIAAFGGHPTSPYVPLDGILQLQFDAEYGMVTGDNEYQWNVKYMATIDSLVATG